MNDETKKAHVREVQEALWRPGIGATDLLDILGTVLLRLLRCAPSAGEAERALEALMASIRDRLEETEHWHRLH
jgi:hypothetical protein